MAETAGMLLDRLTAMDVAAADRALLEELVVGIRRVRARLDALEARVARRLGEVSSFPEKVLADRSGGSLRDAGQIMQRSETLAAIPVFETALGDGRVTAGHVDVLGRGLRQLESSERPALLSQVERLVAQAAASTVEDFGRTVRRQVARVRADDGMGRLERQRRASRLRTWVDDEDGMWCLAGRFDPETGVRLHGCLEVMVSTLFADTVPEGCPTEPGEKQDHLRALALVALTEGRGSSSGRAEIVAVVDTTAPIGPVIDWGLPVEIPRGVLADLAGTADVHTVVVRNGVILHAPGQLNLGRTTRVASKAQRRALRALYATCAVPGCRVAYDHCKLHHRIWWEHGGVTDLANLVPLCERHHHAIHDDGWVLHLGPNRELTIHLPDGQTMSTGPPSRRAA
jgi:hypothetical protein